MYHCLICQKQFDRKYNMMRHTRLVHGKTDVSKHEQSIEPCITVPKDNQITSFVFQHPFSLVISGELIPYQT